MKRSVVRSLCVGIVATAATHLYAPAAAEANIGVETGIVGGTVTRSDTTAIAYAEVQINAIDESGSAWTTTDADGNFSLEVPVGDYEVTAVYPDFWIPISTSIVTVAQGTTSTASFVQAVGTLSGTMLRTTDSAFPNGEIFMSLATGGGGQIAVLPDGSFSALVPTGDWDLLGRYFGFPVDTATATVTEGGTGTASLVFPSGELTANITENGAPKSGVQLHIWEDLQFTGSCPADAATTCEWYQPAEPMDPMMQDMCGGCTSATGRRFHCEHDGYCWWEEPFSGYTTSDESGDIAFVLPEGQFTGSIRVEYWDDPAQDPGIPGGTGAYWGSFDLDQFTVTVTDQSVEARPPIAYTLGTVSGIVTLDGAPMPYAQVAFMRESGDGYASTQTDADGQYTLDVLPGDYRVSVYGNGVSISDVLTTVIDGSQEFDLSDTSGSGGGAGSFIQGVVTRNGALQAGVMVEVVDATPTPASCPADLTVCEYYQEVPDGEPQPPADEMFCHRCAGAGGSFYACQGLDCWWEELYAVQATTGPDGSWSVAAAPNPYTVRLRDHFYPDPAQNPDPAGDSGFWAEFELTAYNVTLGVDETIDLGTYAYGTGVVSGTITSCGEIETAGSANVYTDDGWAWADTGSDGFFSMEIPAGAYDATLGYPYASYPWPSQVVVVAGATTSLDHAFESHGVVEGFVSSNGMPLEGARIELREPVPAGCDMPGASCWHQDEHMCECEFEGRGFSCWTMDPGMPELQECYWYDGGGNDAYTDAAGRFSARVRSGQYNVTAYTPEIHDPENPDGTGPGGGGGSFVIGTLQASAFTCQVTELGAADTPIEAIPPGGTATVELTTDLTIDFASADGTEAGTVSFVATNEEPIDEQPAGLIEVASLYYDFNSTIEFDSATICIPYDEASLTVPEADLRMLHYDDQLVPAQWIDVTESVDTVNNIACGAAPHFSWYVLAQLEVTDSDGDGVDEDVDNCPSDANADQLDEDGDGVGDVCDDDVDGDGVFNAFDDCASTPVGSAADDDGCDSYQRLDDRCPTGGSYKSHGQYVSCVDNETAVQVSIGLLTSAEAEALVTEAAHSSIGKKHVGNKNGM